jgi:hypothetical protein
MAMQFLVLGHVDFDFLLHLGFGQSRKHGLHVHFPLGRGSGEPENIARYFRRNVIGFDTWRQREAPLEGTSERVVLVGDSFVFAFDDDDISLNFDRYFLGLVLGKIDSPLRNLFNLFLFDLIILKFILSPCLMHTE